MQQIKRELELFWIKYRGPFLIGLVIIFIILSVIKYFEKVAEEKYVVENNTVNTIVSKKENYKEDENITRFVEDFISKCNNQEIEEAYKMLENNQYSSVKDFYGNYYLDKFTKDYSIETEFDSINNTYIIYFYENELHTGIISEKAYITSIYEVNKISSNELKLKIIK